MTTALIVIALIAIMFGISKVLESTKKNRRGRMPKRINSRLPVIGDSVVLSRDGFSRGDVVGYRSRRGSSYGDGLRLRTGRVVGFDGSGRARVDLGDGRMVRRKTHLLISIAKVSVS